jgi:hypothetical protein
MGACLQPSAHDAGAASPRKPSTKAAQASDKHDSPSASGSLLPKRRPKREPPAPTTPPGTPSSGQLKTHQGGAGDKVYASKALDALRLFPQDRVAQRDGCWVLAHLASTSSGARRAEEGDDACDLVVAALLAFPHDRDVQLAGCTALRNLAGSGANRERLAKVGGVKVAVSAMSEFPRDEHVRRVAGQVVTLLMGFNPLCPLGVMRHVPPSALFRR